MSLSRRSFSGLLTAASLTVLPRVSAQSAAIYRHGVASGDPLVNRVIIWTRITPAVDEAVVPVEWAIASDASFSRILQQGLTYTSAAFDYTVKVDVVRLDPNTTYYYRFSVRGTQSPVGRTKTLPSGTVDRLRLAVASCSNYPYGFFNAYRLIANRQDLDAVLHLGDYIYEYGNSTFGDGTPLGRIPSPNKEIVTLNEYRQRYAQYRTDPDLQEAHRQHPWIVVWDDHESANNSWMGGAENHQPETEGDWNARRFVSAQAWSEWLPVRDNPFQDGGQIYRTFRFGDLLDLVMLDTRIVGRSEQVDATSPLIADPNRTLLGIEQERWLNTQLSNSQGRNTRWRVLGQQVMMGQLLNTDGSPFNPDQWDGYLASRNKLLQYIAANQIPNVVVFSGDIHSSWGNEITFNPFVPSGYTAQAVEFVGPAITSPGIGDRAQATALQAQIGATHPHVKYVELFRRGYMLVDIDKNRAQAEWYHVGTLTERSTAEELGRVLLAADGQSRLVAGSSSTARTNSAPFAP